MSLRCGYWQSRQHVSVAVCGAGAVDDRVLIGAQEFDPAGYTRVVVADFVHVLQRLVVGDNAEHCSSQVLAQTLDAPHDGARFQIEGRPVALGIERTSADEHNGFDCIVWLFLF